MTAPENPKLLLKDFLPYRLSVLSNRISSAIADLYEKRFSIKVQEWRVMAVLGEQAELSASEIANRTAMDKVAVSRAVNHLLELGHLERHFASHDRRRSVIALSDQGIKIYNQIVPLALRYEQAILDEMNDEERVILRRVFNRLDEIQLHTIVAPDP